MYEFYAAEHAELSYTYQMLIYWCVYFFVLLQQEYQHYFKQKQHPRICKCV